MDCLCLQMCYLVVVNVTDVSCLGDSAGVPVKGGCYMGVSDFQGQKGLYTLFARPPIITLPRVPMGTLSEQQPLLIACQ